MATLPSSRTFLSNLIGSLPQPPRTTDQVTPSNPLCALEPSDRRLVTTLHAIFPAHVLPAFDLLDRRLVTRLIVQNNPRSTIPVRAAPPAETDLSPRRGEDKHEGIRDGPNHQVYLVQSAQEHGRASRVPVTSSESGPYTVRLKSWNCTCAAFTFAAFPASGNSTDIQFHDYLDLLRIETDGDPNGPWEFGGLSTDGEDGGGVPSCKHLIACLLAEKWGILRGYVQERTVSREEMAGLGADL
jgi:hypothetical protein